jgi:hypothetical protein
VKKWVPATFKFLTNCVLHDGSHAQNGSAQLFFYFYH